MVVLKRFLGTDTLARDEASSSLVIASTKQSSADGSPVEGQGLTASTAHPFAGEPGGSKSLPAFFAQPVHIDSDASGSGGDAARVDPQAVADGVSSLVDNLTSLVVALASC